MSVTEGRAWTKPRDLTQFESSEGWSHQGYACAGVGYLISPASTLSFGQLENEFVINFEAAKTDTSTLEMLIKGMASQSSQEVRDQFNL